GATWAGGGSVAGLRAAVGSVRRLPDVLDAVLMSGDLVDNAADGEYELVRELLAQLGVPVYVLSGNHDDRETLRWHFNLLGAVGTLVQYVVNLGLLRFVVLDSTTNRNNPRFTTYCTNVPTAPSKLKCPKQ